MKPTQQEFDLMVEDSIRSGISKLTPESLIANMRSKLFYMYDHIKIPVTWQYDGVANVYVCQYRGVTKSGDTMESALNALKWIVEVEDLDR